MSSLIGMPLAPITSRPSGSSSTDSLAMGSMPVMSLVGFTPQNYQFTRYGRDSRPGYTSRRSVAHLVSSWRVESWSFRSTEETCDSTVLVEMVRSRATSL
jgi:hypothetical protein